jgi:hypothetical protein
VMGFFWDRVLQTICLELALISTSWVARIIGTCVQ